MRPIPRMKPSQYIGLLDVDVTAACNCHYVFLLSYVPRKSQASPKEGFLPKHATAPPFHRPRTSTSGITGQALHRDGDIPRATPTIAPAVPVLAEVDPLPRPKGQLAVCDGYVDGCTNQSTLQHAGRGGYGGGGKRVEGRGQNGKLRMIR